jgi:antitoxin HicB
VSTREQHALEDYLDLPYGIALTRGDTGWTARVVELEGCAAQGATAEEAAGAVRAAMADWIAAALAEGRAVPTPKSAASHSGSLLVRMPPSLHAELARLADRERVSLNTLIVGVLGGAVAWRRADAPEGGAEEALDVPSAAAGGRDRARLLSLALTANLVVVVVVALVAVGLLILAWTQTR